jgi:hypothetical protein
MLLQQLRKKWKEHFWWSGELMISDGVLSLEQGSILYLNHFDH